jgi:hypothetical protein
MGLFKLGCIGHYASFYTVRPLAEMGHLWKCVSISMTIVVRMYTTVGKFQLSQSTELIYTIHECKFHPMVE